MTDYQWQTTEPPKDRRIGLRNAVAGIWYSTYDGTGWPYFGWGDDMSGVWYPEPVAWHETYEDKE